MKYSLMSLMVDEELYHKNTSFIIKYILQDLGAADIPKEADEAYRILNQKGIPMHNGTADFEELVRFTKENGFDGLDMMSFQMELPGKEMKEILEKYNVPLSSVNIISPFSEVLTEDEYQTMLADTFAALDQAAEAGAKNVLLVPAVYVLAKGHTRESCFQMMARGMKACVAYGQEKGLIISTETLESCAVPYGSCGEMMRLFAAVPDLKFTHDTGNPLVANEDPLYMYQLFKDKTVRVHFKDLGPGENTDRSYRCMNGEALSLVELGTGLVDFCTQLKALKENRYDGYITIEGGRSGDNKWDEAIHALQFFREMEKNL